MVVYNNSKMELTRDESKRILRRIELEAYSALVTALRAQGELDRGKKKLLRELGEQLSISTERHRAEIRRAISDDRLSMIAECVCGTDAAVEWESEGRRVVPLMPRLVPQTAFTGAATAAANQAASLNATISSSLNVSKAREREDDDLKARKRQRTTSPRPVQKVVLSSSKTTSAKETYSTVASSSSSPTLPREVTKYSTSLQTKQERNSTTPLSSVSMKIGHPATIGQQLPTKPIVLGGSKTSSSVSMATNVSKHFATLPASCLQAHASVLSGNKNRPRLNLVKQKQKPKFKPVAPIVRLRPPSSTPSTSLTPALIDKTKGKDTSTTPVSKPLQIPRSSPTITLSPKSSLATTLKNTLQQKPQSSSNIVRPVTSDASQISTATTTTTATSTARGQSPLTKTTARRSLPIILPKSLPPKPNIPRRLASILPAPAKTSPSAITKKVIRPACTTAPATSSPIPIAPFPRPPLQSFPALSNTVKPAAAKIPAVSLTGGLTIKRECDVSSLDTTSSSSTGKNPPSKSTEVTLERESLSPVSDILTLVTSPSSVPFVTSSPMKSLTTTSVNEITLKCDEKLTELKDFLKEDELPSTIVSVPAITTINLEGNDDRDHVKSVESDGQEMLKTHIIHEGNSLSPTTSQDAATNLENFNKETEDIDISSLVDELTDDTQGTRMDKDECGTNIPSYPLSEPCPIDKSPQPAKNVVLTGVKNEDSKSLQFSDNQGKTDNTDFIQNITECDRPVMVSESECEKKTHKNSGEVKLTIKNIEDHGIDDNLSTSENHIKEPRTDEDKQDIINVVETERNVEKAVCEETMERSVTQLSDDLGTSLKTKNIVDFGKKHLKDNENRGTSQEIEDRTSSLTSSANDIPVPSQDYSLGQKDNVSSMKDRQECRSTDDSLTSTMKEQPNIEQRLKTGNKDIMDTTTSSTTRMEHTLPATGDNFTKVMEDVGQENRSESGLKESTSSVESKKTEGNQEDCVGSNEMDVSPNKKTSDSEERKERCGKTDKDNAAVLYSPRSRYGSDNIKRSHSNEEQGEMKEDEARQQSSEGELSCSDSSSSEMVNVRVSGRKRKAPPPRDLDHSTHPPGWIRGALLLLQRVSRFRGNSRAKGEPSASSWFIKPVEPADAPGYHKIIKNPMDFGTIKAKLEAAEYNDHMQFHNDMLLVKSNCYKYNPPGHDVRRDCDEVFQFYEAEYGKYAEKLEKCHLFSPKKPKALIGGNEQK